MIILFNQASLKSERNNNRKQLKYRYDIKKINADYEQIVRMSVRDKHVTVYYGHIGAIGLRGDRRLRAPQ